MDRFRTKQTGESYYIEFDFSTIASTLTISSAVVSAKVVSTGVDATATITTVASQSISGQSVFVWVKAGTDGTDYLITCKATASDGSVYELEGLMLVADVPLTAETATTGPGCVVRPILEPVSLAELKLHLRIDHSDEDELLNAVLLTARERVEDFTARALLTQTHDICLNEWPDGDYIELPYGNLQSVSSVKYKDCDGTETTLVVTTDYLVETNKENRGRIVLPYGESWPADTLYPSNPITIRFVCGWTKAADVPYSIKAAIKLLAADYYNMREIHTDRQIFENKAVYNLLYSYKLWSF
jgi:uncharacterized phiE125 gp8 family phage protein